MLRLTLAFVLIINPLALMAQSLSHSLAQCSALAFAMSEWSDEADGTDALLAISGDWFDAAFDTAQDAGLDQAYDVLTDVANEAENVWLSKGPTAKLTGQFNDWTAYCENLGFKQGLDFRRP